jgi:hypothetical protein
MDQGRTRLGKGSESAARDSASIGKVKRKVLASLGGLKYRSVSHFHPCRIQPSNLLEDTSNLRVGGFRSAPAHGRRIYEYLDAIVCGFADRLDRRIHDIPCGGSAYPPASGARCHFPHPAFLIGKQVKVRTQGVHLPG